jgi:membrane associated rhomboid family serine protease
MANASRMPAVTAAVLVLVWLAVAAAGGPAAVPNVYQMLGLSRDGVHGGAAWQVLSYGLLHGNWWHLAINLLVLVPFGNRVERILGGRATLAIFVAGIIGGGAVHLLLMPGGGEDGILVGASGGAMAWVLALTTFAPDARVRWLPISARSLGLGLLIGSALLALADPAPGWPGLGWLGRLANHTGLGPLPTVGHACHLGGGLAGWLAARRILRRLAPTKESLARARERNDARRREPGRIR